MREPIKVLSCFDGISCGRVALERAGFLIDKYYAAEIDPHAIKVAKLRFPDTIHVGSVTKIQIKSHFDLIIGGSPCQGFSKAGLGLNFEDPRSKLFFEFVRLFREAKAINPNVKVMLENVKMVAEWRDIITQYMQVGEPVLINSALVSAQNRKRYYWTNINNGDIGQPDDLGIVLRDILVDDGIPFTKDHGILKERNDNKSTNVDANYFKDMDNHGQRTMILKGRVEGISYLKNGDVRPFRDDSKKSSLSEIGTITNPNNKSSSVIASHAPKVLIESKPIKGVINPTETDGIETVNPRKEDGTQTYQQDRVYNEGGKIPALTAELSGRFNVLLTDQQVDRAKARYAYKKFKSGNTRGNMQFPDSIWNKAKTLIASQTTSIRETTHIPAGELLYRKLLPIECERLQTLPDNYTEGISNTQRYKCIGNGWTIDVIVHILKHWK